MAKFKMPFFWKRDSQLPADTAKKRDLPDGIWSKCPSCAEMINRPEVQAAGSVCVKCGFHFQLTPAERLALLTEEGSLEEWDRALISLDPLHFNADDSYPAKIQESKARTGANDAILCGRVRIGPHPVALGIMDFRFLGASMGSVVGEKVARLFERATEARLPVVICCASGGARMYEGMLSLVQMAKTSGALARHGDAGLAYISVLTHPTTAGVMASFATLGDLILAEPGALIGFAGPRVIKETTQSELPPGFQRSEFLLRRGLIDQVVERKNLKDRLIHILGYVHRAA